MSAIAAGESRDPGRCRFQPRSIGWKAGKRFRPPFRPHGKKSAVSVKGRAALEIIVVNFRLIPLLPPCRLLSLWGGMGKKED